MFPAFSFHGLSDVLIFLVVVRMKACGLLRSYLVGAAGGASLTVKCVCEAEVIPQRETRVSSCCRRRGNVPAENVSEVKKSKETLKPFRGFYFAERRRRSSSSAAALFSLLSMNCS